MDENQFGFLHTPIGKWWSGNPQPTWTRISILGDDDHFGKTKQEA